MRPVGVLLETTHGNTVAFSADLTETAAERARGLSSKAVVDRAMIFEESGRPTLHYTMRKMKVPIDLVFVDVHGFVASVQYGFPGTNVLYHGAPIRWVLELPFRSAQRWRLEPGSRLRSITDSSRVVVRYPTLAR